LAEAERAFAEKHVDDATALLDKAVALNPDDLGVRLAAGDMALRNGLTLHALDKYYLPGVQHTQPPLEPVELDIRSHTGLAFYIFAADPGADQFLLEQSKTYPEADMPQLAYQRWRIFHGQGDEAAKELEAYLKDKPRSPAAQLILGDYLFFTRQPVKAELHYKLALEVDVPAPQWVRMEADCNVRWIRELNYQLNGQAKPRPSCNEPPALLQGPP
jgi:tetratricopeptide (TPR) repeat protein